MNKKKNVVEYFGCNVFGDAVMKERLPSNMYNAFKKAIKEGAQLPSELLAAIAEAMKNWAVENGATHYTHWFQPLTGVTAEKHDSFIEPIGDGRIAMEFSQKALLKGESDASSFPSGGLRQTFEARGYTAWDPTSPAFLKEDKAGVTLCIPTAFCAYTGEALDKKTPLLRSCEAVNKQAIRILRLFGDETTNHVYSSAGAEQEYFLIDKDFYNKRMDLKFCGRTLFGAPAPKGQEMEDHYYGALSERVAAFMAELDEQLWKLGVYSKTKHNEVAPCQHEIAPIYEEVNISTDHNQLVMETLKKVASHHGFACLLHEKPFAGINGSGKHNNWSLTTDGGENLLDPGSTPHENARFLLFLCAIIKAIDTHADLIRASAASAGNDHRLGANEAPPCIISIFMGDELTDILEGIETGDETCARKRVKMDIGVSTLPKLRKDTTDRNRTSPFAFTGNKFEFRMVGSAASIAGPNTVINTVVADTLCEMADRLEKASSPEAAGDFSSELHAILKETIKAHKRIIFNGNGYSAEWIAEAERRGLPNINNSVDAFCAFTTDKAIALFERHGVYSRVELESRWEIKTEKYVKVINIEAKTMLDIARHQILPAGMKYKRYLAESVASMKQVGLSGACEMACLNKLEGLTGALYDQINRLEEKLSAVVEADLSLYEKACRYRDDVFTAMQSLRSVADDIERMVSKEYWPMPQYSDMLFDI